MGGGGGVRRTSIHSVKQTLVLGLCESPNRSVFSIKWSFKSDKQSTKRRSFLPPFLPSFPTFLVSSHHIHPLSPPESGQSPLLWMQVHQTRFLRPNRLHKSHNSLRVGACQVSPFSPDAPSSPFRLPHLSTQKYSPYRVISPGVELVILTFAIRVIKSVQLQSNNLLLYEDIKFLCSLEEQRGSSD